MAIRVIKDQDGNEQKLQYALGNISKRDVPASDLLPLLWRKDPSISIRDIEICQIYLGDIYDAFSDVHVEEEQWDDAARYLELSLRLRKRTEKAYGRGLASVHTKYAAYYALKHQYEDSNKHFLLAASVFAHRSLDKIEWLYRNLNDYYKLNTKCNKDELLPNISKALDSKDESVLMPQDTIQSIRAFCNDHLIPCIKTQIFGGQITEPNVKEAVNNITDYFQIIDSIMDLYSDNMVDIEEGRNQQGLSVTDQSNRIDETQRVKKMVDEVWRTDSILKDGDDDFDSALGFKKINKTGDIKTTLHPLSKVSIGAPTTTTTTSNNDSTTTPSPNASILDDKAAHVPVVKRKNKGPAPGEDVEKKARQQQL
jgi:hypothetical protein